MKGLVLLAATGTSVLFGLGSVLQKAAADRVVAVRRLDARLLPRLLRQGRYLLGWMACKRSGTGSVSGLGQQTGSNRPPQ